MLVSYTMTSLNVYCSECRKVWRVLSATNKLQSVSESNLSLIDDCAWKKKVEAIATERLERR